jgi:hypothetical protein
MKTTIHPSTQKRSLSFAQTFLLGCVCLLAILPSQVKSQATADADAKFAERCKAPGVLQCLGFDDSKLAGTKQGVAAVDTKVMVSGKGSLHVPIAPNAGMAPGNVVVPLGKTFGENSSLYIQWRQRFSPSMVDDNLGGNGMKQIVIYDAEPCCQIEVAMLNQRYRGFPQFYTNVMRNWMYKALPGGDSAYQYNETETYCTEKNKAGCDKYTPDEWMTFYYEQHIAKWGEAKSTIKAYWAREGKPLKQYIHLTDWKFSQDKPGTDNAFRTVWIGPFSVDRTAGKNLPAAETWYDEFIISTEPIADPNKAAVTGISGHDEGHSKNLTLHTKQMGDRLLISLDFSNRISQLEVTDFQGKTILKQTQAGADVVAWNTAGLPKGLYLIRAQSGSQHVTQKWSILK